MVRMRLPLSDRGATERQRAQDGALRHRGVYQHLV